MRKTLTAAAALTSAVLLLSSQHQALAQSKIIQLYTPDGGPYDGNCTYYLTNNLGWVAVDMGQPNAAKLASDVTFWATLGATINIIPLASATCGQTIRAAWTVLPLVFQ
jgi:hypothetical protein